MFGFFRYTGFDVRLDNATGIRFGPGAQNVLTLRADASFGSGILDLSFDLGFVLTGSPSLYQLH